MCRPPSPRFYFDLSFGAKHLTPFCRLHKLASLLFLRPVPRKDACVFWCQEQHNRGLLKCWPPKQCKVHDPVCGRCIKRDGRPHGISWNWTNRFLENTRLAQTLKPWVKINMAAFIWFQCALHANQISKMCNSWQQEKVTSINVHLMPPTQMWYCSKIKIYTANSKYLFFWMLTSIFFQPAQARTIPTPTDVKYLLQVSSP